MIITYKKCRRMESWCSFNGSSQQLFRLTEKNHENNPRIARLQAEIEMEMNQIW